jgi:hypothetical protein
VGNGPISRVGPTGLVDLNLLPPDERIHGSAEKIPTESDVFTVVSHGSTKGLTAGPDRKLMPLQQVVVLIKEHPNYTPGKPVRLLACNVGKGEFPQQLANALGCKVSATKNLIWIYNDGKVLISGNQPKLGEEPKAEKNSDILAQAEENHVSTVVRTLEKKTQTVNIEHSIL